MASALLAKAKDAAISVKDAVVENAKIADIQSDYVDGHSSTRMTTDHGVKIANANDWLKVGSETRTGPMLLEDQIAREKIHRFDHERIPERVVHARGAGAFGTFTLQESASDVTYAKVLTDTSRTTPVFVRFSTVLGNSGSADSVRDVRGFAVKMYTQEGNWDIVGNDIPVFFIQDAMKFPDIIHAGKPEPHNGIPQAQSAHNNFWDFQYLHSEASHMFMWAMSDRGIPRSYRMMQGFGVNTFRLVNADGVSHFVKFHYTPELGVHSLVWDEALKLAGQDPDFHRKDLMDAIEAGAYPRWKFGIQTIPESEQDKFEFDILDATKIWPEELVPIRNIGTLELNRNIDEYFTQTEQVAFCTSHVVPGIDFSDDPLLQGRNFSYFDTQLSRLGINWQELPINRPVCPYMNMNRDGQGRHRITKGSINYWPNRFGANPPTNPREAEITGVSAVTGGFTTYPSAVAGAKQRLQSAKFREHFNQAELFYNSLSAPEQAHLTAALSFELDHCTDEIVYTRMVERLSDISLPLAQAVAEKVGAPTPTKSASGRVPHGKKAKGLSQLDFMPQVPTIATRKIAILIADGFDEVAYYGIKSAVAAAGALPFTIGPKRQPLKSQNGTSVAPDHHFEGMRSTMFDALFIPGGTHVATLAASGRAVHWVREAFGHLKAIGGTGEGVELVQQATGVAGMRFATAAGAEAVVESYGVVTARVVRESSWKDKVTMAKGAADFLGAFFHAVAMHRNFEREMDGLNNMVAY